MTIKRREGGSNANGANGAGGREPGLFEGPPAASSPPAAAPQPCRMQFVAPGDPLLARLAPVEDFYLRALARVEYAELACWLAMPDPEAVAFRAQPLFAQAQAAGRMPTQEDFARVCQQILASRPATADAVRLYGPTAERTVLVRVPLVQTESGEFVPDPGVFEDPKGPPAAAE